MKSGRPYPKDWERKLRVTSLLYERGMTFAQLAVAINMKPCQLSLVVWGIRISPENETRIAAYFGMARDQLFPKPKRTAQVESEVAA